MINILCYGDSNTWGYKPGEGGRFPFGIRWTGCLQRALDSEYRIIEEGLGGRTINAYNAEFPYKNGMDYLLPCLISHSPLDLIIIMLGTNDTLAMYDLTAEDIQISMDAMLKKILAWRKESGNDTKVLLIAPVPLDSRIVGKDGLCDFRSIELSRRLADIYRELALEHDIFFMDAAQHVPETGCDGCHISEQGHEFLAKALEVFIRNVLKK